MGIVIAVYLLIAVSFAGMVDWSALGISTGDWGSVSNLSSPLSDVSKAAGLGLLATVITVGAVVSTTGAGNDWVLFQGRIPYAMAEDGLFWGPMDKIHKRYATPYVAIIFASALTIITQVLVPSFPTVVLIASITTLIPYAAASVSLAIMRKTHASTERPFKLPAGTALSAVGFLLSTILIYWASWPWTLVGAVATLIGFPLYLTVGRHKLDMRRQAWLVVYIVGLAIISLLGDTNFIYENFLPIGPMGVIPMPYDLAVLIAFGLGIFAWAYKANT
jgi:basic amino acid/polyamine antiporter, APA family